jgi:hypothetical protein
MARASPFLDLGDWCQFEAYHEKPTKAEVEAVGQELDKLTGRIGYQRRQNPNPSRPAMVIGAVSVKAEAPVIYNGGNWFAAWQDRRFPDGRRPPYRRFLLVRFSLMGEVFMVDSADAHAVQQRRRAG